MKRPFQILSKKIKTFLLFTLITSLSSCGSFNSSGFSTNDGIYGNNNNTASNPNNNGASNQNGAYYKNYFDQKAQEYGFNDDQNDSIITNIDSYSSSIASTDITYGKSYGSWGDSPDSVNVIYRDFPMYWNYYRPYYGGFYGSMWYDPFSSYYNPFYGWGYSPYESYGYWGFMYRPWWYRGYNRYGGYWNSPYNRYNQGNVSFMNGRRGYANSSASSGNYVGTNTKTDIGSRSISNYNVGRNESEINNNNASGNKTVNDRNINRIYYSLKNSRYIGNNRDYQNVGESEDGMNSNGSSAKNSGKTRPYYNANPGSRSSNFKPSRLGNSARSNSNSVGNSSTNGRSYNISRSSSSSNNRRSFSSGSSSVRSSSGGSGRTSPSRGSSGSSRGPR